MKKIILSILTIASIATTQAQNWTLDNAHSSVKFSITHMLVSETEGNFKKFTADVTSSKEDFSDVKVAFNIDVNSINTDNEARDNHLKGDDFFNAEKFPEIKFTSSKVTMKGKEMTLTGQLTMHGVTKEVVFIGKYNGTVKDLYGMTRAGFKLSTTIMRSDFGLTWNKTLDQGGLALSNEVEVVVNIEITKKQLKYN